VEGPPADLTIHDGEFSSWWVRRAAQRGTLLRILAGLVNPQQAARCLVGDRAVTGVRRPAERGRGLVQSTPLSPPQRWPATSAFGLRRSRPLQPAAILPRTSLALALSQALGPVA